MAVAGQLLPAPKGTSIFDVVNHVGYLQLDPTNSIARNHLLVLWSRLGNYDEADLERLRWESRELYEYAAAIVPVSDHPIHKTTMRLFPDAYDGAWPERLNAWVRDNAALRRAIVSQLRKQGPLPSREIEDIAEASWRSTGWTNDRNVSRMLEFMHAKGEVVVAPAEPASSESGTSGSAGSRRTASGSPSSRPSGACWSGRREPRRRDRERPQA